MTMTTLGSLETFQLTTLQTGDAFQPVRRPAGAGSPLQRSAPAERGTIVTLAAAITPKSPWRER
jgi:hypothetical protein